VPSFASLFRMLQDRFRNNALHSVCMQPQATLGKAFASVRKAIRADREGRDPASGDMHGEKHQPSTPRKAKPRAESGEMQAPVQATEGRRSQEHQQKKSNDGKHQTETGGVPAPMQLPLEPPRSECFMTPPTTPKLTPVCTPDTYHWARSQPAAFPENCSQPAAFPGNCFPQNQQHLPAQPFLWPPVNPVHQWTPPPPPPPAAPLWVWWQSPAQVFAPAPVLAPAPVVAPAPVRASAAAYSDTPKPQNPRWASRRHQSPREGGRGGSGTTEGENKEHNKRVKEKKAANCRAHGLDTRAEKRQRARAEAERLSVPTIWDGD
jgi:hypothetical protein